MMKRLFYFLFAAFVGLFFLPACDTEQKGLEFSPNESEAKYTFGANTMGELIFQKGQPLMINVYRQSTVGDVSIKLNSKQSYTLKRKKPLEDSTFSVDVLNIPTTVEFANGQGMATVKLYANDSMDYNMQYNVTLALDSAETIIDGNQKLNLIVSLDFTWKLLGTGQFYDNLAYGVGPEVPKETIWDVKIYKAEGYDRWKIIDPFGNRDWIANEEVWGPTAVQKKYSKEWIFYLKDDGKHLSYSGTLYPGILNEEINAPIAYRLPSTIHPVYAPMEDKILFYKDDGVFQLNPAAELEGTTSWYGQIPVWAALPGVDLRSWILGK